MGFKTLAKAVNCYLSSENETKQSYLNCFYFLKLTSMRQENEFRNVCKISLW